MVTTAADDVVVVVSLLAVESVLVVVMMDCVVECGGDIVIVVTLVLGEWFTDTSSAEVGVDLRNRELSSILLNLLYTCQLYIFPNPL